MEKITILENEYITMWYYPDEKIIYHQIHTYTPGELFRDFLLRGSEVMEKNNAAKWLSDERNNQALNTEDLLRVREEDRSWGDTAQAVGWKYWAIVQPEHLVHKMWLQRIAERYAQNGGIVRFFAGPDEAMEWLKSRP